MRLLHALVIVGLLSMLGSPSAAGAQADRPPSTARPTVAVRVTGHQGTADALQVGITQQLITLDRFTVVDRAHLEQVMQEQQLSARGQVLATTEVQLGRMLGVNYLVIGKVMSLTWAYAPRQDWQLRATFKLTLSTNFTILDVASGRIVQSIDDVEKSESEPFLQAGVTNANVAQLAEGHVQLMYPTLASATVDSFMKKLDVSRFVAAAEQKSLLGRVLKVDGDQVVVSIGSDAGVTQGQTLGVYEAETLRNPDTNKSIETFIKRGTIVVVQVEREYSVARKVSGAIAKSYVVRAAQGP